ncbi:kinase-like domain-containing protein [Mycena haematopus]|nr:kinase-like domain-containing protein [Mycena haematopus]
MDRIIHHVYLSQCFSQFNTKHLCSPTAPCSVAHALLAPMLSLRLVDSTWNNAVTNFRHSLNAFFAPVEEGTYYPHAWHVDTRARKAMLLSRYRVFRTISSEEGNRGVYLAYDLGGAQGCSSTPTEVVIKAWVDASDFECQREVAAYRALALAPGGNDTNPCTGVPVPRVAAAVHDAACDVHGLVLAKLGPTLEDLRALLPGNRFDARMVLGVGIQMIDRYQIIHARGLIHNGIKPGNICLAPRYSTDAPSMLYAIDFGLSFALDLNSDSPPLPSAHRIDAVGNRRFMSVFAHHGISQSQRDDLESLAYLLSYLFHGSLPWDIPNARNGNPAHIWRVKLATPASVLFRDMPACFVEFWRDVKALAYAEVPDYGGMRERFVVCLKGMEGEEGAAPRGWWDIWDACN